MFYQDSWSRNALPIGGQGSVEWPACLTKSPSKWRTILGGEQKATYKLCKSSEECVQEFSGTSVDFDWRIFREMLLVKAFLVESFYFRWKCSARRFSVKDFPRKASLAILA